MDPQAREDQAKRLALSHDWVSISAALEAERKAGREESDRCHNCEDALNACNESAYKRGKMDGRKEVKIECDSAREWGDCEGYRRGLEEAAEAAENSYDDVLGLHPDKIKMRKYIADRIRQLGKEK